MNTNITILNQQSQIVIEDEQLNKLKQGPLKQAQAAFLTLVFEATKCDADAASMRSVEFNCLNP